MVTCKIKLGQCEFEYIVIVCQNMHRPLIIGEDFLRSNTLDMYYDEGKRHLEYKHKEELIESIDTLDYCNPRLLLRHGCTIPSHALAVLNV